LFFINWINFDKFLDEIGDSLIDFPILFKAANRSPITQLIASFTSEFFATSSK